MLTQRYALYVMLLGLTLIVTAAGFAIRQGMSLLLVFVAFNGLLITLGGVWMWEAGKRSL